MTLIGRILALMLVLLASDTHAREHARDPYEKYNRYLFEFNQTIDTYLLRPVAVGYRNVMPGFASRGVTNFFSNLRDVPTLANQVLQLKHREAARTSSRLIFNTVFGLAGLIDVGTEWGLPMVKEDFGQTMNFYGVPEGPYVMLPLLGPATVTDAIGRIPDAFVDPLVEIAAPESYGVAAVKVVDTRAGVIPAENLIVGDRYEFVRNAYLQARTYQVNDGKVEEDPFLSDDFEDY